MDSHMVGPLALGAEKAPPGCLLHRCLREEGACGGIKTWRPASNLTFRKKLMRQKLVICHLDIFFFVRKWMTTKRFIMSPLT